MGRVYNFSAGPAVLPEEVLREAADEMLDGFRYINPGSVSIPKENTGNGYIIFENGTFTRKLLK